MATGSTDFSGYTADAQPSDWTERWNPTNATSLVRTSGLPTGTTGGAALEITNDGVSGAEYLLSWDAAGTPSGDVDILIRAQAAHTSDVNTFPRIYMHTSGNSSNKAGYASNPRANTGDVQILRWITDTQATIATIAVDPPMSTWYWQRLRYIIGTNTLRFRFWTGLVTDEPAGWQVDITETNHTSGWIGVGRFGINGTAWIDYFAYGTAGDVAPSPSTTVQGAATASQGQTATTIATLTVQGVATASQGQTATTIATVTVQGIATATQAQEATSAATLTVQGQASGTQAQAATSQATRTVQGAASGSQGQAGTADGTTATVVQGAAAGTQDQVATTVATVIRQAAAAASQAQAAVTVATRTVQGAASGTQGQTGTTVATGGVAVVATGTGVLIVRLAARGHLRVRSGAAAGLRVRAASSGQMTVKVGA